MLHWATAVKLRDNLVKLFPLLETFAKDNQTCLRKAVGCGVWATTTDWWGVSQVAIAHNGPSRAGAVCSNVVGACGCSHAEPRAMRDTLRKGYLERGPQKLILVCTYSPCTNCANIINDAGVIDLVCYDTLTQHDQRGAELLAAPVLKRAELEAMNLESIFPW